MQALSFHSLFGLGLLLTSLTAGCSMFTPNVHVGHPQPNIALSAELAPSELKIDSSVPNEFKTPPSSGMMEFPVHDWHQTLTNGFQSAFSDASSGHQLQLLLADLSFAPNAVTAQGQVRAVRAQIRFKARLVSQTGEELAVIAGTVESREANTQGSDDAMTLNAAYAVESLYEAIAAKLGK